VKWNHYEHRQQKRADKSRPEPECVKSSVIDRTDRCRLIDTSAHARIIPKHRLYLVLARLLGY